MSDFIGTTVGQYQIVEQIGKGGMATIFKAYQPSIDRYVAIKILPSQLAEDENFVKRFAHEARAIAALEHPHILPVHDFGTDNGITYMVMRYVKGGTLTDVMGQAVPYERSVKIVADVATALDYAHERGVVHRDIKPSNILLGEHSEVLLTDFGIAKLVEESSSTQLTAAGSVLGTPAYMSPEQAQGQTVDGRSDIYSLGVVFYELLTGRPPYEAETPFAIVLKHINDPLPPPRDVNPDIPEALERVVLKAMAKDPQQRFETAGQMEQALQNAQKEMDGTLVGTGAASPQTETGPEVMTGTAQQPARRSIGPFLIVGGAVVLLLCLLAGGGLVTLGILASAADDEAGAVSTTTVTEGDNNATSEAGTGSISQPATDTATQSQPDPGEQEQGEGSVEEGGEGEQEQVDLPVEESDVKVGFDLDDLEGDLLFADDFETDNNGWFTGEESDESGYFSADIADGQYNLFVGAASEDGNFGFVEPFEMYLEDFIYAVDFAGIEHNGEFGYGLTFRGNSDGDYYLFEVDNDGFIVLVAFADDDWQVSIDYTETPAINQNGPNQLMVKAVGSSLTFYINGEEVAALEDDSFEGGSIGLVVATFDDGDELLLSIDRVIVRELSDDDLPPEGEEAEPFIAFAEYFESDENGWSTGEFEDEYSQNEITIEGGKYTFSVTSRPEQTPYSQMNLPNREFSNFILSVEATPRDTAEHYTYGLAFRENAAAHTYTFEIGNDGLYRIELYDGEWRTLKDWSSSEAIKVGQTNELTVYADGETLIFFVNEEELTAIEDSSLAEGQIGLIVNMFEEGASATVDFDNLIVTILP